MLGCMEVDGLASALDTYTEVGRKRSIALRRWAGWREDGGTGASSRSSRLAGTVRCPNIQTIVRYRDPNRVECMFGKLKQQHCMTTRYDKTVLSFESFLKLAAARLGIKSFVNAD